MNRKRIQKLMLIMGLEALTSVSDSITPISVPITKVGQAWGIDITYIRMKYGFLHLTAVIICSLMEAL